MRQLKKIKGVEIDGGCMYIYESIISQADKMMAFKLYEKSRTLTVCIINWGK